MDCLAPGAIHLIVLLGALGLEVLRRGSTTGTLLLRVLLLLHKLPHLGLIGHILLLDGRLLLVVHLLLLLLAVLLRVDLLLLELLSAVLVVVLLLICVGLGRGPAV